MSHSYSNVLPDPQADCTLVEVFFFFSKEVKDDEDGKQMKHWHCGNVRTRRRKKKINHSTWQSLIFLTLIVTQMIMIMTNFQTFVFIFLQLKPESSLCSFCLYLITLRIYEPLILSAVSEWIRWKKYKTTEGNLIFKIWQMWRRVEQWR